MPYYKGGAKPASFRKKLELEKMIARAANIMEDPV